MAEKFKIGDIVQLKSGGPKMTVVIVHAGGDLNTTWFAGSKKEAGHFPSEALVAVTDSPKEK